MTRLTNQCVLVTGAAKRLGAAIASAAHREGANVVVHYGTSKSEADALCAKLNSERAKSAIAIQTDLLDTSKFAALVSTAVATFGRLDVLVNNASTFYPTKLGKITEALWQDLMGTNLKAPLFLSQAAADELRKTRGLILNMVDIHGVRPLRDHVAYSIAKAGLAMLTKSLARELGPDVRVNGIAPGPVLWPDGDISPSLKQEIVDKTALKRSGSPDDIARTALFFMCEAPFVTGQILAVDGGRSV